MSEIIMIWIVGLIAVLTILMMSLLIFQKNTRQLKTKTNDVGLSDDNEQIHIANGIDRENSEVVFSANDAIVRMFTEEADELFVEMDTVLQQLKLSPHSKNLHITLQQCLYKLKGSGRFVGATEFAEVVSSLDDLIVHVLEDKVQTTQGLIDFISISKDKLVVLKKDFQQRQPPSVHYADTIEKAKQFLA